MDIKLPAHENSFPMTINSSLIWLQNEIAGRINMGEGVLDTVVYEVQALLLPKKSIEFRPKLNKFLKRPIESIFEEVKSKDRRELDSLVLEALGLDPGEYLDRIYEGLCELVRERLDLAKMRSKVKGGKGIVRRDV